MTTHWTARVLGGALSAGGALRRAAYQRGVIARDPPLDVPVISVGAIAAGGSGKTPVARLLAERLAQRLCAPVGLVCGGYGGRWRRRPTWLRPAATSARLLVGRHGDEALLHARWMPAAIVVAGADKAAAARVAVECGARAIVVDDGFQQRRLPRDLDVVLVDGAPSSLDREPSSALRYADALWLHHRDGVVDPRVRQRALARLPRELDGRIDIVSVARPRDVVDATGERLFAASELRGRRVFLLANVAAPQAFVRMVQHLGATVVGQRLGRDHAALRWRDVQRAAPRAELVLTTEKDLARSSGTPLAQALAALRCDTELVSGSRALDVALDEALRGERAPQPRSNSTEPAP